ncbi:MAG: DmsC/YnfH family molybdoenzyme membrane anchor subunit [Verrucomicrobiota bacterium]
MEQILQLPPHSKTPALKNREFDAALDELVDEGDLISRYIQKQQELTAVEEFSKWHEVNSEPSQAKYYHNLIPLEKPTVDEQYAFEVDLDTCSGCKACVSACHSLNGLDANETWRDVGTIFSDSTIVEMDEMPAQYTVTTACHHCAEPGCLDGCPVLAYDKDESTGIVRHLDDQCIGCQYCILKCPYDVPKYSEEKGIVRKCDMCHSRLSVGEAPACVQACPNEAIRIIKVDKSELTAERLSGSALVPGAYDSGYTKPSSRYISKRKSPSQGSFFSANTFEVAPEHSHMPLVFMLVLTQLSVGSIGAEMFLRLFEFEPELWLSAIALFSGLVGIGASVLHLGQPLKAWRAFLGLRKSWLSREVVGFGLYAPMAIGYAGLLLVKNYSDFPWVDQIPLSFVAFACFAVGLICVICSVMVYVDTQRVFWRMRWTLSKFLLSTTLLGAAASYVITGHTIALTVTIISALTKGLLETGFLLAYRDKKLIGKKTDAKSAQLMLNQLRLESVLRFVFLVLGVSIITLSPWVALGSIVLAELLERYLFFRAVVAYKMPGGIAS